MYTVDASVWVNGFDQREAGHEMSRQLLELLRTQALPLIEPTLVLAEVAGAISRIRQDPNPAQAFATTLGHLPNVTVLPLDTALGQRALCAGRPVWLTRCGCGVCGGGAARRMPGISLDHEQLTRLANIISVQTRAAMTDLTPPPEEASTSCPSC